MAPRAMRKMEEPILMTCSFARLVAELVRRGMIYLLSMLSVSVTLQRGVAQFQWLGAGVRHFTGDTPVIGVVSVVRKARACAGGPGTAPPAQVSCLARLNRWKQLCGRSRRPSGQALRCW
ncbi:hypothetical protein ARTHRO9AX_20293 [Arthrobacter sp. 9AX]|nr:hypothetical protein ARTHRO9AX_20293 [Arthrobacter sp. 9AX]